MVICVTVQFVPAGTVKSSAAWELNAAFAGSNTCDGEPLAAGPEPWVYKVPTGDAVPTLTVNSAGSPWHKVEPGSATITSDGLGLTVIVNVLGVPKHVVALGSVYVIVTRPLPVLRPGVVIPALTPPI